MRIVVIEAFGHGGLAHYAYNLCLALCERGHEVVLVTTVNYELDRAVMPDNLRLVRMIGRRSGWGRDPERRSSPLQRKAEAVTDAFSVARFCRSLQADLVHVHSTNPIAMLYVDRLRRLDIPVVLTAHVVTPHEPMRFQDPVYRRLYRKCDLVIAHSRADERRLVEEFDLEASRVTVIPHGEYGFFAGEADTMGADEARRDLGIASEDCVALFFGYIREYKGLDLLLDAWPQVVAESPQARLLIAGDPVQLDRERRREFERRAEEVGAIHRFEYIPFSEVGRYFVAADALVMPYRRISQSGVLFLALALGVPVVATRVGGLPEMLRHGESALLVEPESSAALADALIRVMNDAPLRARLERAGRDVAADHSWSAIAERTEEAFEALAQSFNRKS